MKLGSQDIQELIDGETWPMAFICSSKFLTFITPIPDAVIISNEAGEVVQFNENALRLFGYTPEEFSGLSIEKLVPADIRHKHASLREWFFDNPRPRFMDNRNYTLSAVHKSGEEFCISAALFSLPSDQGPLAINYIRDISEQRNHEEDLTKKAFHDTLTNLPNRHYFQENLSLMIAKMRRHDERCALFFIDLDKFKPVNDLYGHDAGDKLLEAVATRLIETSRNEDFIARLGGDEFAVIMYPVKTDFGVKRYAQRLIEAMKKSFKIDSHTVEISVSIGITIADNTITSEAEFLERSDRAMYAAKKQGGNEYCFANQLE